MEGIVKLYQSMKHDERLQRDWERNQPRLDRALEAPLIVRTPREVATAALLAIKLKFEPDAKAYQGIRPELPALRDAQTLEKRVASRLLKVLQSDEADEIAKSAVAHSVNYYVDRAGDNPLIRIPWSTNALQLIASAPPEEIINPALKPTMGINSTGTTIANLSRLFLEDSQELGDAELQARLRSKEFTGLGPERADAVGVFAFRRPWPIVDEYLWRLLHDHRLITDQEAGVGSYDARRRNFERHWQELLSAYPNNANELAATLYLWADEASKFGYRYHFQE